MIKFTVISAKAGIHLCQWVTDTSSPLRYSRNDEFPGHRVFFSNLLEVRASSLWPARSLPLGSPWPQVRICASTICVRRLLVIEAEQLLRVVVQDLVGDFLRQAEALDIGKGLPVDLPILQHRIVAAGHDVIGAERFEGA